jgi:hypothetical protein
MLKEKPLGPDSKVKMQRQGLSGGRKIQRWLRSGIDNDRASKYV